VVHSAKLPNIIHAWVFSLLILCVSVLVMSSLDQLIAAGKSLGFEGKELQEFVSQQQTLEREERAAKREETKLREEHQVTLEQQRLSHESHQVENQLQHEAYVEKLKFELVEKEKVLEGQLERAKL